MSKQLVPKGKQGKKNWIKGAVNPEHEGFCTPVSKSTCTPKRKAFAMTMKKHHGFHKRDGGELGDGGSYVPMSQNGSKLTTKSGSATLYKNGKKGVFEGIRTISRTKGLPNDTLYQYKGVTPDKTEIFNFSTNKQAPINQLNFNGRMSTVSPDSVKMYRERVNNLARILPPQRW